MNGGSRPVRSLLCWRNVRWLTAGMMVAPLLWACNSYPLTRPPPRPEGQSDLLYEVNPLRQLDLLFVIDNSHSMTEEQMNLSRNFPAFMKELEKIEGGLPDLHVAVVSSDFGAGPLSIDTCQPLGDQGRLQVKGGCGFDPATAQARFLAIDSRGNSNFTGDLSTVFGCMANVGKSGCGYEHHLQAIRGALSSTLNPENRGFLRPDAHLGIIILADEDDCSADPDSTLFDSINMGQSQSLRCNTAGHVCGDRSVPAEVFSAPLSTCKPYERNDATEKQTRLINVGDFVSFVKDLKPGRPDKILVSGVIGWDARIDAQYRVNRVARNDIAGMRIDHEVGPACSNPVNGVAAPAVRLKAFIDAFGPNGSWHDICETDLSPSMAALGRELGARLSSSCLPAPPMDLDLDQDGVQADCQVVDRLPTPDGRAMKTPLAACAAGPAPCWEIMGDATCGAGFRMFVRRAPDAPAPVGTIQQVSCLTCTGSETDDSRCPARM
jgi:hypothetical protein